MWCLSVLINLSAMRLAWSTGPQTETDRAVCASAESAPSVAMAELTPDELSVHVLSAPPLLRLCRSEWRPARFVFAGR